MVDGWTPPPDLADATRVAISMTLNGSLVANSPHSDRLRETLRAIGPGTGDPWIAAMVTMLTDIDPRSADGFLRQLRAHAASADREVAALALPWLSQALENMGDPDAAMDAAERGLLLADETVGPWSQAIMHTMAAQLAMQLGRAKEAAVHAHAALPVLDRLGARDDAIQLRSMLALVMISDGDIDAAAAQLADLDDATESDVPLAGGSPSTWARPSWRWPGARSRPGWPVTARRVYGCGSCGSRPSRRAGWSRGCWWPRRRAWPRTPTTPRPATRSARRCSPGPVTRRCRCSTRTIRTWTIRSAGWCCWRSAGGGCCVTRCRSRTRCG
ncbi:hypothetical protein ACFQZ4_51860 [Catellatospora coxensis]